MVSPDDIVVFTEHAQSLRDQHAARKRWRGICRRFVVERAAGARDRIAELAELEKNSQRKLRKRIADRVAASRSSK